MLLMRGVFSLIAWARFKELSFGTDEDNRDS